MQLGCAQVAAQALFQGQQLGRAAVDHLDQPAAVARRRASVDRRPPGAPPRGCIPRPVAPCWKSRSGWPGCRRTTAPAPASAPGRWPKSASPWRRRSVCERPAHRVPRRRGRRRSRQHRLWMKAWDGSTLSPCSPGKGIATGSVRPGRQHARGFEARYRHDGQARPSSKQDQRPTWPPLPAVRRGQLQPCTSSTTPRPESSIERPVRFRAPGSAADLWRYSAARRLNRSVPQTRHPKETCDEHPHPTSEPGRQPAPGHRRPGPGGGQRCGAGAFPSANSVASSCGVPAAPPTWWRAPSRPMPKRRWARRSCCRTRPAVPARSAPTSSTSSRRTATPCCWAPKTRNFTA